MPFRRDGSVGRGWKALLEGQKDLRGSADVRRPSWMDGRDWEALSVGREGFGGPPRWLVSIWRPIRRAKSN